MPNTTTPTTVPNLAGVALELRPDTRRPWELRDDEDRQGATLDAIEAAVTAAVIAWLDARCDVGDDCAHKLARMIESGAHRG